MTDEDDANLKMVNSPDWGANINSRPDFTPGATPTTPKPTPKQSEVSAKMMGGEAVRNVRDRPYVIRDVSPNKHLPAPPLGHSTGHGLSPLSSKRDDTAAKAGSTAGGLSAGGGTAGLSGTGMSDAAETRGSSKGSFRTQTQQAKANSSVRVESGKRNLF